MYQATLNHWACLRRTKAYPGGGYYQDQSSEIVYQREISGETEIAIFESFYKLNNNLHYCNGSYYRFADKNWEEKYQDWLKSDDYKAKSFNLYYGNGVVD